MENTWSFLKRTNPSWALPPGWELPQPRALASGPRAAGLSCLRISALVPVWCFHSPGARATLSWGWGQHTSRNPQPPPECQGSGQSRAEARTCPEVPQGSNKGGRGGRAFLTFPTFPAGRGWMEKPSLNVPSVPFRRRFLSFTQTLSLHRKQKGLFNMPTQMS